MSLMDGRTSRSGGKPASPQKQTSANLAFPVVGERRMGDGGEEGKKKI